MSKHQSSPGETPKVAGSEHIQPSVTSVGDGTAIQTPPPPGAKPSPLRSPRQAAPKRGPLSRGELAVILTVLDIAAIVVVMGLAFLLASFAVKNSDFWAHLGTGRLIAQGEYKFGTDPFAYTTEGTYWANHSWLPDLLMYLAYDKLGGPAVVVIKAALLALLALILLQIREPGQRFFWPVVLVGIAILAMIPRLIMQPAILSYLFLAITLCLLLAPRSTGTESGRVPFLRSSRRWFLLPIVFWLWVNCDGWFLLGPIILGLYVGGLALSNFMAEVWEQPPVTSWKDVQMLAFMLLAGIVATLINPHHVFAYTLPSELSPTARSVLTGGGRFNSFFVGPWDREYFNETGWYGLGDIKTYHMILRASYHLLALIGLVSLVRIRRPLQMAMQWELVLPCLFLFGLSCASARCVPFFVVAMAPIAALGMHRLIAPLVGAEKQYEWRVGMIIARGCLVAVLLALIAAAWPGWLSSDMIEGQYNRQVQWKVTPDPSYEQAAKQLQQWHDDGTLPANSRGFIGPLDLANYCAWYCPQEKVFCDYRFGLYSSDVLEDYLALDADLEGVGKEANPLKNDPRSGPPVARTSDALRARLRKYEINHVARTDRKQPFGSHMTVLRMAQAEEKFSQLYYEAPLRFAEVPTGWRFFWDPANRREWPMIYFDGHTTMCAWNDLAGTSPTKDWWKAIAPEHSVWLGEQRLWYAPDYRKQALGPEPVRAPANGTNWPREARTSIWERYGAQPPPRPVEADTAHGILRFSYSIQRDFAEQDMERAGATTGPALFAGGIGQFFGIDTPLDRITSLTVEAPMRATESSRSPVLGLSRWRFTTMRNSLLEGRLPPVLLYLAMRYARQAIRANPEDPSAYRALADSYFLLEKETLEKYWQASEEGFHAVRQTQRLAALEQALLLDPTDWETHLALAHVVEEKSLDTALMHYNAALDGLRQVDLSRLTDSQQQNFEDKLHNLEKQIDQLHRAVDQRETQHTKDTRGFPVRERARLALQQYQLAEKALQILGESEHQLSEEAAKNQEIAKQVDLEIQILLGLGRINHPDVLDTLTDEGYSDDEKGNPWKRLANFNYPFHAYRRAMAIGDFKKADELLAVRESQQIVEIIQDDVQPLLKTPTCMPSTYLINVPLEHLGDVAFILNVVATRMMLNVPFTLQPMFMEELRKVEFINDLYGVPLLDKQGKKQAEMGGYIRRLGQVFATHANFSAQRGVVAMEEGDIDRARKHFQQVIDALYPPDLRGSAVASNASPLVDCPGRRIAIYWLRELAK